MPVGGPFNAALLGENQVLHGHRVVSRITNHKAVNK